MRTVIHRNHTFEFNGEVYRCVRGGDYGSGWNWEVSRESDGAFVEDDFDTLAAIRDFVDAAAANGWPLVRDDPKSVDQPDYRAAKVVITEYSPVFDALVSDVRWNGFEVPLFTLEETRRLVEWYASTGDDLERFAWEGETLVAHYLGNGQDERREIPTVELGGEVFYALGDGWTWELTSKHADAR
jgi:hypothetical protein